VPGNRRAVALPGHGVHPAVAQPPRPWPPPRRGPPAACVRVRSGRGHPDHSWPVSRT
jgi:hypothetical protein